jgi:hypothetical protein
MKRKWMEIILEYDSLGEKAGRADYVILLM